MDKKPLLCYSKAHMEESELPKKIFWWTLFFLFWITSTIIIGYAFGYRFSPERGVFVYGGSISIKSTPQNADVYINGVLYPAKNLNRLNNSYHIPGIEPGFYLLEIKYPGYASWSKKISIHSGISTEFWNIVLTKNSYEQTAYDSAGTERFFISPRKNVTAIAQKSADNFLVNILTAADNTINNVFSSNEYQFTNDEKENIEWTPQAEKIIIPALRNDNSQKDYFIVDVATKETIKLRDIASAEDISHVRWDPDTKNALFYLSGGSLFRLDLNAPTEVRQVAQNISSYELASGGLYFFQLPEGIVYKTNFDGTDTPKQITRNAPDMNDPSYEIIVYDDDRITFLNQSNKLYIYNHGEKADYFQILSQEAQGSQFSDDGKKLLYWSNNEVSAYFIRIWEVQPTRAENEIIPITRLAQPIKDVQWSRDYEHVLFTVDNKLKLTELDQRDHRNTMDMINLNSNNAKVVNNNSDGLIYFTDMDNGNMTLRTIEFPEKTTLLQNFGFGAPTPTQDQTVPQQ
jgi:hypothetical protein